MILRAGTGWQTTMADLALILFLVTAQAVREEQIAPEPEQADQTPTEPVVSAAPKPREQTRQLPEAEAALALHKPARGESVGAWLSSAVTDERQIATITVGYTAGGRLAAVAEGSRLLEEAELADVAARLTLAPDTRDETVIAVDFVRTEDTGTNLAD